MTCTATPPVIHHTPAIGKASETFVIEKIITKKNVPTKKASLKLGGVLSDAPSHFAKIAPDGTVVNVIVVSEKDLATGLWGDPTKWIKTSPEGNKEGRKNYAGIGYTYDEVSNSFIPPKAPGATVFDSEKAMWIEVQSATSS